MRFDKKHCTHISIFIPEQGVISREDFAVKDSIIGCWASPGHRTPNLYRLYKSHVPLLEGMWVWPRGENSNGWHGCKSLWWTRLHQQQVVIIERECANTSWDYLSWSTNESVPSPVSVVDTERVAKFQLTHLKQVNRAKSSMRKSARRKFSACEDNLRVAWWYHTRGS